MAHLTCWIGLDDSSVDNGCVHYVPGSHQWDLLESTGLAGDMDAIRAVLTDAQWDQFRQPVAVELKKGECTFHHPLMVHGSFANRTERPRRAAVINVVRDGVTSATDEPLLHGVPAVGCRKTTRRPVLPAALSALSLTGTLASRTSSQNR